MSHCTITFEPNASDADQLVVQNGLRAFNTSMTSEMNRRPIVFFLRDEAGAIQGGLVAQLIWDFLDVKWLWVADAYRGKGHGSAMLLAAEEEARKGGCRFATLDTFSYQARPFYEKLGYHVFAAVEGFPGGFERYFMKKAL